MMNYSILIELVYLTNQPLKVFSSWMILFIVFCSIAQLTEIYILKEIIYWLLKFLKIKIFLLYFYISNLLILLNSQILCLLKLGKLAVKNQQILIELSNNQASLNNAYQQFKKNFFDKQKIKINLSYSEEKFRYLVENINEVVWISNLERTEIFYVNPAYEQIWGRTCDSLYINPKTWMEAIHPEDRKNILQITQDQLNQEYRIVRPDGSLRWIKEQTFLIRNQIGESYRLIGIAEDITEYKGVESSLLRVKVSEFAKLEFEKEIAERRRLEERIMYAALHDGLTGLPNRAFFVDRLEQVLTLKKQQKDYLFAILFLDMDRFKLINDSLGHIVGDQFLRMTAFRLKACLRLTDTAARFGGDEFTVLLEGIKDVNDALRIANRIQQILSLPFNFDGKEVFSTVSIGIAMSESCSNQPEDLLRNADTAMYYAKSKGKARCELFQPDMHTQALKRLELETHLRHALDHLEFCVYYQPIVALIDSRIVGFEALVRWQHPEYGLINPSDFIPVAEETGLIVPIGYWVLYEACRQLKVWQICCGLDTSLTISVNLSVKQFLQPNLISHINEMLREISLPPSNLMLEITESVIMENSDETIKILLQLQQMGIKLLIDDFGTGYSSLGRLHQFPISILKIDRSFISEITTLSLNLQIAEAIITLAHKLGISVTAEGVETETQLSFIRDLECEYAQGYFFSPPLDSEAVTELIKANQKVGISVEALKRLKQT